MTGRTKRATGRPQQGSKDRSAFLRSVVLIVAFVLIAAAGEQTGEAIGARDVRTNTIVRLGVPGYTGNFFGECASYVGAKGSFEACATDARDDGTSIPPGGSFRLDVPIPHSSFTPAGDHAGSPMTLDSAGTGCSQTPGEGLGDGWWTCDCVAGCTLVSDGDVLVEIIAAEGTSTPTTGQLEAAWSRCVGHGQSSGLGKATRWKFDPGWETCGSILAELQKRTGGKSPQQQENDRAYIDEIGKGLAK